VCFQDTLKLVWSHSWMTQTVRQWIPNCWTSRSKGTSGVSAATNSRYSQLSWRAADRRWWLASNVFFVD